ncbi:MAG: outer membrane lipid asymmetry maintenance protein MlaD [Brachymonas sp.]|jgi:phospholipid/cholesterol/gamma-HCH transport system substrate-binding protein|nr:outer membrane lipid asymmetry maintenance protein MlaD [Brachymonas sp.]MBP7246726.1 outer membrane lipid asymmetry maintenance protein MlaD [Brachymonas sp.]MBP7743874.1 outer membrane lipid asymmetry maintenance protein MlaD [Brachymonas sp.]MBP8597328.1 outer membrane lipid asymmetry maintenance protein MlaD [Brachymonas sp.]MBP8747267.1 outer membrane lipid asymmetry maintenance protein MlaD [Brachymonas sp.]
MQRSKVDIWVGLFVMAGIAALLFLALKSANMLNLNTTKGYQITAMFQDIGGLKPQAAVRSSGVVVGRVSKIAYDSKAYQAAVTIEMDERYHFPSDSSLRILTSGLLGDQYIGVDAGYSDASWKQGDTVSNTQSAVVLETLIGQFMNSKALDAAKETTPAGQAAGAAAQGAGQ